jgi:uncharacterized protein
VQDRVYTWVKIQCKLWGEVDQFWVQINTQTVFLDENALFMEDPEHSGIEDRFLLLGISYDLRVITVCHCYRYRDKFIRIISARKATKTERNQYLKRQK